MKVIVSRGSGDNPAPDVIVDELCSTEMLGIKRGQTFLYDEGFDRLNFSLTVKIPNVFLCGDIIEFYDPDFGNTYRGKITGFSNNASKDSSGVTEFSQSLEVDCFKVVD